MSYVIIVKGLVGSVTVGNPEEAFGYLKSYDPEANGGGGDAVFTGDIDEAMVFDTIENAVNLYRAIPNAKPVREDGKPNRPLTAFNVSFEKVG